MLSEFVAQFQSDPKQRESMSKQLIFNYRVIRYIDIIPTKFHFVKQLYLNHNNLQSLEGIEQFKNLQHIHIQFNYLRKFEDIMRINNRFAVKALNFKGNPLTNCQKYSYEFLQSLFFNLTSLDETDYDQKSCNNDVSINREVPSQPTQQIIQINSNIANKENNPRISNVQTGNEGKSKTLRQSKLPFPNVEQNQRTNINNQGLKDDGAQYSLNQKRSSNTAFHLNLQKLKENHNLANTIKQVESQRFTRSNSSCLLVKNPSQINIMRVGVQNEFLQDSSSSSLSKTTVNANFQNNSINNSTISNRLVMLGQNKNHLNPSLMRTTRSYTNLSSVSSQPPSIPVTNRSIYGDHSSNTTINNTFFNQGALNSKSNNISNHHQPILVKQRDQSLQTGNYDSNVSSDSTRLTNSRYTQNSQNASSNIPSNNKLFQPHDNSNLTSGRGIEENLHGGCLPLNTITSTRSSIEFVKKKKKRNGQNSDTIAPGYFIPSNQTQNEESLMNTSSSVSYRDSMQEMINKQKIENFQDDQPLSLAEDTFSKNNNKNQSQTKLNQQNPGVLTDRLASSTSAGFLSSQRGLKSNTINTNRENSAHQPYIVHSQSNNHIKQNEFNNAMSSGQNGGRQKNIELTRQKTENVYIDNRRRNSVNNSASKSRKFTLDDDVLISEIINREALDERENDYNKKDPQSLFLESGRQQIPNLQTAAGSQQVTATFARQAQLTTENQIGQGPFHFNVDTQGSVNNPLDTQFAMDMSFDVITKHHQRQKSSKKEMASLNLSRISNLNGKSLTNISIPPQMRLDSSHTGNYYQNISTFLNDNEDNYKSIDFNFNSNNPGNQASSLNQSVIVQGCIDQHIANFDSDVAYLALIFHQTHLKAKTFKILQSALQNLTQSQSQASFIFDQEHNHPSLSTHAPVQQDHNIYHNNQSSYNNNNSNSDTRKSSVTGPSTAPGNNLALEKSPCFNTLIQGPFVSNQVSDQKKSMQVLKPKNQNQTEFSKENSCNKERRQSPIQPTVEEQENSNGAIEICVPSNTQLNNKQGFSQFNQRTSSSFEANNSQRQLTLGSGNVDGSKLESSDFTCNYSNDQVYESCEDNPLKLSSADQYRENWVQISFFYAWQTSVQCNQNQSKMCFNLSNVQRGLQALNTGRESGRTTKREDVSLNPFQAESQLKSARQDSSRSVNTPLQNYPQTQRDNRENQNPDLVATISCSTSQKDQVLKNLNLPFRSDLFTKIYTQNLD